MKLTLTLSCPPNGLTPHLSAKHFWPVYEEAEKLDCALAVHGGCYGDLGFSSYTVFPATRALGMPVPLAIAATGMIVDGVFDAFPNLRVGFLEGGTSWIPMVLDRLERELEYGGLRIKRKPLDYFTGGKIFVGCEGNEAALASLRHRKGRSGAIYVRVRFPARDFPRQLHGRNR